MKILVSGGAGFIGSALIRFLLSGTPVHAVKLDGLTYVGNLKSLGEALHYHRHTFEHVKARTVRLLIVFSKNTNPPA